MKASHRRIKPGRWVSGATGLWDRSEQRTWKSVLRFRARHHVERTSKSVSSVRTKIEPRAWLWFLAMAAGAWFAPMAEQAVAADGARFTRLTLLPAPKIIASAKAFNESYVAGNVLLPSMSGRHHADYASLGLGEKTFIDFDFGQPVRVAGFRHIQRQTIDTIAESSLIFSDAPDFNHVLATVKVRHVDEPGATTFAGFAPVTARYVRWQVTSVLPGRSRNVGGKVIEFFAGSEPEASPGGIGVEARVVQTVERKDGRLTQPLKMTLNYPYAEPLQATIRVEGQEARSLDLKFGNATLDYTVAAADTERTLNVAIEAAGGKVASRAVTLKPMRKLTIYILAHSHTDIGYTAVQTEIEEKQVGNLLQGIAIARRTASYPPGARFVWNVEVLWAADLYLQRLAPKQRAEFFDAVKRGQVALNGMYLNELTGLCRPEELVRLFRYATQLGARSGVAVDSAMISDVPGYTWGTVTAMAQAGIRYFSAGINPNEHSRIGDSMAQWESRPFWWIGPDGRSKVLVWVPFHGYSLSHVYRVLSPSLVDDICAALEKRDLNYDITYIRWSGNQGDNSVPDPAICDFVKEWNETHAWPQFVISSTSEAFRAFEKRYGDQLPRVRGDWTPYWEDGAGSSAAETAMNRASSERLAQAETLWAMLDPARYPAKRFEESWNNVLLYSEHTWGAHCSVTEPANPFTAEQWTIKQAYATAADHESRRLLSEAAQSGPGRQPMPAETKPEEAGTVSCVDVFNTTSWPRSEVVLIPYAHPMTANFVTDEQGRPVPAQRLASRDLAVLVRDLPPFSGRRYTLACSASLQSGASFQLANQQPSQAGSLRHLTLPPPKVDATKGVIENDKLRVRLDEKTGGIVELRAAGIEANLADTAGGHALNDYLYLIGDDPAALQRNGPVTITVREHGPLVASLRVESDAPGCHKLSREIRLFAGADHVELLDTVDKKRIEAKSYLANEGKESVHFAFPFNVPGGELRFDASLSVIRPEKDQMPAACKNWLSVGRWADVANRDYGVTWVTLDAPLVEAGCMMPPLLNSRTTLESWRKKIEPTQKLFSWVMNNHEDTNYRAYQEGTIQFRYVLRPHRGNSTDAENSRFATGFSQPLVPLPGHGIAPGGTPLLRVEPAGVLVTALKPSDDGRAWIVRLLGAGGTPATAKLAWSQPAPKRVWLSDTSERPLKKLTGDVPVPAWGVVTLRAEMPK